VRVAGRQGPGARVSSAYKAELEKLLGREHGGGGEGEHPDEHYLNPFRLRLDSGSKC
jgi:hypothetical protein